MKRFFKKEKFVYNANTLRYERVVLSLRTKLVRALGILSALLVFSFVVMLIGQRIFPSSSERRLREELAQMTLHYDMMNEDLSKLEKVIGNLKKRDESVYRMMFGVAPIDDDVWEMGRGGVSRYESLKNFSNSGLMISTNAKLDKLSRQMALQSISLDSIAKLVQQKEKMLSSIPSIRPIRTLKRDVELLSGYGMRIHPIHKIRKMHWGMDFAAPTGTPIYVTGDGVVEKIETKQSGYGQSVLVNHGFGYRTLYAHMSTINVREGQKVKKGDPIGKVGSTGTSTAPHCHYEIWSNGVKVNPIHFCMDGLSPDEYRRMLEQAENPSASFDYQIDEHDQHVLDNAPKVDMDAVKEEKEKQKGGKGGQPTAVVASPKNTPANDPFAKQRPKYDLNRDIEEFEAQQNAMRDNPEKMFSETGD
jgi:murein DD-endopeptidase MepM/ murein hydrolase activator NlpD